MMEQTAYEADASISLATAFENSIFESVRHAIDSRSLVEIVQTLKVNGENA
jgi:hypothetical protein